MKRKGGVEHAKDPYRYIFKGGAIFILFMAMLITLLLPCHSAMGYGTTSIEALSYDFPFFYDQDETILQVITEGGMAYIAYRTPTGLGTDIYAIAAVDLSDPELSELLWSFELSGPIEDMALTGTRLYVTTGEGVICLTGLDSAEGPSLFEVKYGNTNRYRDGIDPLFSLQTSKLTGFNTFPTSLYNLGFGLNSLYNLGSGFPGSLSNMFQTSLPQLSIMRFPSQFNFGIPTWGIGKLPVIMPNLLTQFSQPVISPFNIMGQTQLGRLINSPLNLSMGFPSMGYPGFQFSFPVQTNKPATQPPAASYRSPVRVRLPLNNTTGASVAGQITLDLYDLDENKKSSEQQSLTLAPGQGAYALDLTRVPANTDVEDFVKYNLRYRFDGGGAVVSGEKSLFMVADKMEVRILGADSFYAGASSAVGVHAFVHGAPVAIENASVTVDLIMGDATTQVYSGKTDDGGLAEAMIGIPEGAIGTAKIRARVGSALGAETLTENIKIERVYKVLLTTDKPIYQPGQTIHIRTLSMKKPDLLPEAGREIIIECEDPKGNKVFRVNPVTDDFGVASADFVLGSDINLGAYKARAIIGDADNPTQSEKTMTVERYVLPKFKVELETDAEYYAPGGTVSGTIQAKYFFGKPVSQAPVTIEAAKFDVEFVPFQTVRGQTDADGFFSFALFLPNYFVGLPLEQGQAFVKLDIKVSDTAGHDESVIRELTVAKDPIRIQVIPESGEIVPSVENHFYILTTDPKGQALATSNMINFNGQVLNINTDEQGMGGFDLTIDEGASLVCQVASQANGQSALVDIDLSGSLGTGTILLRTDKAIYNVGQSMVISIYTPEVIGRRVFIDIIRDRQTLFTKGVDIDNGQGQLEVDVSADMAGTLLVEAYYISLATETASDIFRDKRIIYVNPAEDIQVSATLDKEVYLPGEKAQIQFHVDPPQPAALGISIVDEAVYALQENRPGLLKVYFSMEEEIMKPRFWPLLVPFEEAVTEPYPDDEIQEITQITFALAEEPPDPGLDESSYPDLVERVKQELASRIDQDAEKIAEDLGDMGVYTEWSYENALREGKIKAYPDPWGNAYALEVGYNQVTLISKGPDEKSGTMDDISYTKPYERVYTYIGGGGLYGYYGGGYGGGYAAYYSGGYGAYSYGSSSSDGGAYTSGTDTQAGFMNPTGQGGGVTPPGDGGEAETQEPAKIRRDFPETLLWEPMLITGSDGSAFLDMNMADSITTWRMSTMVSTKGGKLGGSTDGIVVFQDFFIDIDLPAMLTQNDEIEMPVAVYNYLSEPQSVKVKLERDPENPWFELMDVEEKWVNLDPGEVTAVRFRIRVVDVGWHELTVFGYGTKMSDAIARRIEVVPDGMAFYVNISDRMSGESAVHEVTIPHDAIDGASKIMVKVYPGIFSQVVEGLDKLFQVPYGCFCQSSAVTWPNVLVLDYMISSDQLTPEIEMKARQYVNLGYQRLLTFECPNGGFDWYGSGPGLSLVTAYGLMEFADMARVQYVDPSMIRRTQDWLVAQQKPDGSWTLPPDSHNLYSYLNSDLRGTAFAVWALLHSGYTGTSAISKGKDYIRPKVDSSQDNYTLALCANALLEDHPADSKGLAILDRLDADKIVEGDTVHWTSSESESITYSRGGNLDLETTAMIAYAMIKANWRYPNTIKGVINYIVTKKEAFGLWDQVEATVLSLRVLIEAMSSQIEEMEGEILITINGTIFDKEDLPILKVNPVDSSVLRLIDLQPYTIEGQNTVGISLVGAGNLLYQIVGTYFLPWEGLGVPSQPQLDIDLKYDSTTLTVDDTIMCTVKVTNTIPNTVTRLGMIDLGIPPGFSILWEDFETALEEGTILKYESTNRQLTLYLRPIQYGEPVSITYRLQAKYPLKVTTPVSCAYDYYNPDIKDETRPVKLTVVD